MTAQRTYDETAREALSDPALEECRQRARKKERIAALGVDPNRLTQQRCDILTYVKDEGAVSAKDVASKICKRNVRTANKHMRYLEEIGLLTPIRSVEFKLSPLGLKIVAELAEGIAL